MTRNERILEVLKNAGKSQTDLAHKLGLTRATVSQRLNGEKDIDSIEFLEAVSHLTRKPLSFLITGTESMLVDAQIAQDFNDETVRRLSVAEVGEDYLHGKGIRPVVVTVGASGDELVTFVPVKAQAGYMRGYADPHYIEQLPAFSLPALAKNATYRMFQVDGPSMQQLGGKGIREGDIVIAQYVEDIFSLRDNRVYVIVSTEGIAIKRVINRLRDKESPCLVLMSDNKNGEHPNYLLKPKQILEVWEAKKFISSDFSFDTDMYQILAELQVEQAKLKEQLEGLNKPVKK